VLIQNIVSPSAVLLRCLPCGHDLSPKVLNPLGWSICWVGWIYSWPIQID